MRSVFLGPEWPGTVENAVAGSKHRCDAEGTKLVDNANDAPDIDLGRARGIPRAGIDIGDSEQYDRSGRLGWETGYEIRNRGAASVEREATRARVAEMSRHCAR